MTAAHSNKSIMALDWKESVDGDGNAGSGGWLASAGLDKTVKVRDQPISVPYQVIDLDLFST